MKNKLIIGIISFLVIFVSISGCIDTDSSDSSTNTVSSSNNQDYNDNTNTKSSTRTSSKSGDSGICSECGGTGRVMCYNTVTGGTTCAGTGIVQGGSTEGLTCRVCDGTGSITCPNCNGDGYI